MKEIYQQITEINNLDPVTSYDLRLTKLYEENGELAQAINMLLGRKTHNLDPDQLDALILEEVSDTIQCLFSYMIELKIKFQDISDWVDKLQDTKVSRPTVEILKSLHINIGHISDPEGGVLKSDCQKVFIDACCLAFKRGFSYDDIEIKIGIKNQKWLSLIEKRQKEEKLKEFRGKAIDTLEITKGLNPSQRELMGELLTTCEKMASAIIEITE